MFFLHAIYQRKKRFHRHHFNAISKTINIGMCLTYVKYILLSYYFPKTYIKKKNKKIIKVTVISTRLTSKVYALPFFGLHQ